MKIFFRLCFFGIVLIFLFSGCGQIAVPGGCDNGGVLGGGYDGYGGSGNYYGEGYSPPLQIKLPGDWLHESDGELFERLTLQNDGTFILENNMGVQVQTSNGTYGFDEQKLELRTDDLYYLFEYTLASNRLSLSRNNQITMFVRQSSEAQ